jgi:peroxiredoxin
VGTTADRRLPVMEPGGRPEEGSRPTVGLGVLHLFYRVGWRGVGTEEATRIAASLEEVVERAAKAEVQVVTVALLGHKADLGVMALGPDLWALRELQSALGQAGLELASSYVSLTEVSEYAAGVPEEVRQARLYPRLPPEGLGAFCFYPMSKRRGEEHNWYALPFEERLRLMHGHGAVGREFRGSVVQLVTGSVGLDDWEWGVTLFARRPDDLKACVYRMRFDEASARYAEFGPFYAGMVVSPAELCERVLGVWRP